MSKTVRELIQESIQQVNQMLPKKISLEPGVDTALFGPGGVLDSMSLVSLIVDLEERLEKEFHQPFILASEKAMSQKRSPFLTIGTLADYIETLKDEA